MDVATIVRYYYWGYKNEYNVLNLLRTHNFKNHISFKIDYFFRYIKINNDILMKIFYLFSWIIAILEPFVYTLVVFYLLLQCFFLKIKTSSIVLKGCTVVIGKSKKYEIFKSLINSTDISLSDLTILNLPSTKITYKDCKCLNILQVTKYSELFLSAFYAILISFFVSFKNIGKDILFRSYNSFEYLLTYFALNHVDNSNTLIFYELIDRWVYLFGARPNPKIYIQHGILNRHIKQHKCGNADIAYFVNKEQKQLCMKMLFDFVGEVKFRSGITLSPIQRRNGVKYLLLICNSLFFEIERKIISQLQFDNLSVMIKLHPKDVGSTKYNDIINSYNVEVVNDFPDVDFVVSYDSSLADEYIDYGKKVLKYSPDIQDDEITDIVDQIKR